MTKRRRGRSQDMGETITQLERRVLADRPRCGRFALVLQAVPDPGGAPAIIRLRRFLKMALRSYGLRCVRCERAEGHNGEE